MRRRPPARATVGLWRASLVLVATGCVVAVGLRAADQIDPALELTHPAVSYGSQSRDPVALLNERLDSGLARLELADRAGYLPSLLDALDVPVESQLALFSKTSLQAHLVSPDNPRVVYFNDEVAVAWMPGGFIEVAAQDPVQGSIFYLLAQQPAAEPRLQRDSRCLQCHYSQATRGVPGLLARSIPIGTDGAILPWLGNYTTDHRSPIEERWGGWYVTGRAGAPHLGNTTIADRTLTDVRGEDLGLETLAGRFDTRRYLSPLSDIAALLVFNHQIHMTNLLTRLSWEARIAGQTRGAPDLGAGALAPLVVELVDYLLFVDEAPLDGAQGAPGFVTMFAARGPRDRQGRSLRELDLGRRLLRYPCSYMIYSDTFGALPPAARAAVYERLWRVLSGADADPRYGRLSQADRQAVIEILRDTKPDLPAYFSPLQSRP